MNTSPIWRKSIRSNTQGGECVEVADLGVGVGVRDSKDIEAGRLILETGAFSALVGQIKDGKLDL
ncbi:DUF397 domain-containing protein [Actinomadura adrarensis]|uniref:DUF397 domain-containing protein n=1 Tax=Actinomadura adrarensis TaxID=1819600 RepID=A0ABW3CPQ6_9ACTN